MKRRLKQVQPMKCIIQLEINSNESSEEVQNNEEAPSEDVTIEQDLIPEVKELMDKALEGDPDAQLFLASAIRRATGLTRIFRKL